jgi:mannose-1-phosphate guanylyltransferase
MGWSDVGSWEAVWEERLAAAAAAENGVVGDAPMVDVGSSNVLVVGGQRLIATLGVHDLCIVDAGDALLVCDRRHSQRVKELMDRLRAQGLERLA